MSRNSTSAAVSVLILAIVGYLVVAFGIDCAFAQVALWCLGSFHVIAGFWQVFWSVFTLSAIVSSAASGAVRLNKR